MAYKQHIKKQVKENVTLYFNFADYDFEQEFSDFDSIKSFVDEEYEKGFNTVDLACYIHNSYYNCTEVYDSIEVTKETKLSTIKKFIKDCLKEYNVN